MKLSIRFHRHAQSSFSHILTEFGMPSVIVEVGCFEGDTTCNLAWLLNSQNIDYQYYAIDPFLASENLTQEVVDKAKEFFVENIKEFSKIEFLQKKSIDGLIELYNRGIKADIIYIDGSHLAKDVLADCVIGFEMLKVGGVMLFDDSVVWRYGSTIQDSPKIAIDNFIQCNWGRLEMVQLPNGYQTAIKRTQ